MRPHPSIESGRARKPTVRLVIHRQAARTTAEASTQLRTVASIPAQRIPITGTVTIPTGAAETAMAFTSPDDQWGGGNTG